MIWVTRWVPLVVQELFTILSWIHPHFCRVRVPQSLVFYVVFFTTIICLLSLFFCLLSCQDFFQFTGSNNPLRYRQTFLFIYILPNLHHIRGSIPLKVMANDELYTKYSDICSTDTPCKTNFSISVCFKCLRLTFHCKNDIQNNLKIQTLFIFQNCKRKIPPCFLFVMYIAYVCVVVFISWSRRIKR